MTLTDREREVLRELASFARSAAAHPDWHPQWAKPMDVGGRDGSHHSYTLGKLVTKGLAEKRQRGSLSNAIGGGRGSLEYRITEAGKLRCSA
jgi:hypothetical protein